MNRKKLTGVVFILAALQLAFSSCKKTETTPTMTSDQAHRTEMIKKSYEGVKKVIVAKVNGEPITEFMVAHEIMDITPEYVAPDEKRTPELFNKIHGIAVDRLILKELVGQDARKRGMKASPQAIDAEIGKIKGKFRSDAAYQEYLANNGFTEDAFRQKIEQQYLFEMIAGHEIYAKVTVTDAALRERYKREKAGLKDGDGQMTFEAAKGIVEQRIRDEEGEKRIQKWAAELKKKAKIEILKGDVSGLKGKQG